MKPEYSYPWEPLAMKNEPMPNGLPLEQQWGYQSMALLYRRYKAKEITREQGATEKGLILYEVGKMGRDREVLDGLLEHHRKIEQELSSIPEVRNIMWGDVMKDD